MSEKAESQRGLLETFANPYPKRDYEIRHIAPEFTSLCPMTGQPDFGTITIEYVANKLCVELKSLKFYLQSFRERGIFYEAVTNQILEDLSAVLRPRRIRVESSWTPRGGLRSVIVADVRRMRRYDGGRASDETRRSPGRPRRGGRWLP